MATLEQTAAVVPAAQAAGASTLRRNVLTFPEVMAQSVANMAPTAAMAILPLLVFLNAGNGTWASFLIAIALMVCVGYCCAVFARRMTSAGSFYVWVARALGPVAGHTAGWGLQLGYIVCGMATTSGVGIFMTDFLGRLGVPGADSKLAIVILYVIGFVIPLTLAIRDVRISARTAMITEACSIAVVSLLCVLAWVHHGGPIDTNELTLKGATPGGILVGTVLAIFAFVGFESAGALGLEAANPFKSVRRAIFWSALVVGCFYLIVAYSQILGFEGSKAGFAKSQAPFPDLATIVGLGWLAPVIDIGISASGLACTLACVNAAARIAMTMAHDGMGVTALTNVHDDHKTPHIAMWVVTVPMVAIPIVLVLAGVSQIDLNSWVGTLSTFGFMLGYGLVAVAAPVYLRKIGESYLLAAAVGGIGAVVMAFVFLANWLPQVIPGRLFPALSGALVWLPYIFLAWVAAGIIWYVVVRLRDPEAASQLGSRYEDEAPEPSIA